MLQNIERLRRLGKCILFSTHIMREVEKLCDRVAIVTAAASWPAGRWRNCSKHGQPDLEELFYTLVS